MALDLSFRPAGEADIPAIVALVNSAYRGDASRTGWTTEADLLGGQRADADMVRELIHPPDSLLLLCLSGDELLGSAHLSRTGDGAYLGMFAVRPDCQGQGVGKAFLAAAEDHVREHFGARTLAMTVIHHRRELIAFYERRGYRRTGETEPFPQGERYGLPKVDDLSLVVLRKVLEGAACQAS